MYHNREVCGLSTHTVIKLYVNTYNTLIIAVEANGIMVKPAKFHGSTLYVKLPSKLS